MNFFIRILPATSGGTVKLKTGTRLQFVFTTPDGINYFEGEVVKTNYDSSGYNTLLIRRLKGSGKRIQRREYFRLKVNLGCNIKKFSDFFRLQPRIDRCKIDDISAGGLKVFSTKTNYSRGEVAFYNIDSLDEVEGVWGKIVHIENMDKRNIFKKKIQLQFIYVDDTLRETLVKFVNRKQREQARNTSMSF